MNVLVLSPAFPAELSGFSIALGRLGVNVFGVGEQHSSTFRPSLKQALTAYLEVRSIFDEDAVIAKVVGEVKSKGIRIDRVESLWEPTMILAARLREALAVKGMDVAQTTLFRDKEAMKVALDRAGIRTPHHYRCSNSKAVLEAAAKIGYPVIIKPIAGAGSADTYRCDDEAQLRRAIDLSRHVPEVSVEEFITGEEFTFDTITAKGKIRFHNICWYRPRALIARQNEWVSPQTMILKDPDVSHLAAGRELGAAVLKALGFDSGFTHMEWFLKENGEAVFGEIGARPPGARTVDLMNWAHDVDLYRCWAEVVAYGEMRGRIERAYNAAMIFKRAIGQGVIQRIEGLDSIARRFGKHLAHVELQPIGAPRRNWKQTLVSDGFVVVRHPDLQRCCEMADAVASELAIYAA
jgi:formate-dependent phosphoribosylglycinamide formyltransferase (GAR transformylase)